MGRVYLISKGYAGGELVIQPTFGHVIDGESSIALTLQDARIKVINNGVDTWYII